MWKGPDPYLDVVLQNRRVFAREAGIGIFFFSYCYYHFDSKGKKLPSKSTSFMAL